MHEAEFRRLAREGYQRIPIVREAFADLDPPLSIALKLARCRARMSPDLLEDSGLDCRWRDRRHRASRASDRERAVAPGIRAHRARPSTPEKFSDSLTSCIPMT
jgi:hypothetical protein